MAGEETVEVIPSESGAEIRIHAEATKALTIESKPPAETHDIVVVASNPQQMQVAQTNLISWAETKQLRLQERKAELQENLDIATKNKWRTATLKKAVKDIQHESEFYEKIETALRNGYVIVPNFDDLDIFAIRTTKRRPKDNRVTQRQWSSRTTPVPKAQESDQPPVGEGRYVDADAENRINRWTHTVGNDKTAMVTAIPEAFRDVTFPFLLGKPAIFEKTGQALKHLCFDDIGILPGRHKSRRRGDPMIIGRVLLGKKRVVSFLITWFVDTKDL